MFGQDIRIWDAKSGEGVEKLTGHTGGIFRLAWRPDAHLVASGGGDGSVRLWAMG